MTGPWRIEADYDNESECEEAHPVRLGRQPQHYRGEPRERRDAIEQGRKGYLCPGACPHFYTTWVLVNGTEQGDWFNRYQEAVAEHDRLNALDVWPNLSKATIPKEI